MLSCLAKLKSIEEGWHGQHWRRVAVLQVQGKDSAFEGATLVLEAETLAGVNVGDELVIEIRPVGSTGEPSEPVASSTVKGIR